MPVQLCRLLGEQLTSGIARRCSVTDCDSGIDPVVAVGEAKTGKGLDLGDDLMANLNKLVACAKQGGEAAVIAFLNDLPKDKVTQLRNVCRHHVPKLDV